MRMGATALTRDGINALDMLRTKIVEYLAHQANAFVLAHARSHKTIEFIIGRVNHHTGCTQQRNLILRLDDARLLHQLLSINNLYALSLQRKKNGQLDSIDADRLV